MLCFCLCCRQYIVAPSLFVRTDTQHYGVPVVGRLVLGFSLAACVVCMIYRGAILSLFGCIDKHTNTSHGIQQLMLCFGLRCRRYIVAEHMSELKQRSYFVSLPFVLPVMLANPPSVGPLLVQTCSDSLAEGNGEVQSTV